jgi:hypothetical protein
LKKVVATWLTPPPTTLTMSPSSSMNPLDWKPRAVVADHVRLGELLPGDLLDAPRDVRGHLPPQHAAVRGVGPVLATLDDARLGAAGAIDAAVVGRFLRGGGRSGCQQQERREHRGAPRRADGGEEGWWTSWTGLAVGRVEQHRLLRAAATSSATGRDLTVRWTRWATPPARR